MFHTLLKTIKTKYTPQLEDLDKDSKSKVIYIPSYYFLFDPKIFSKCR